MNTESAIESLLSSSFASKRVRSALKHFRKMVERFQVREWEDCVGKGGKFVEAILKALYEYGGYSFSPGSEFKVDTVINELAKLDKRRFDRSIRLLIPRACRFAYDIASNRGGRHDSTEIDPNEMDATITLSISSWILAEIVRLSAKGMGPDKARNLVEGIMDRRYPLFEDVEGRVYFHGEEKSAPDIALAILWYRYPERLNKRELKKAIMRHNLTENNTNVALTRISHFVDDDGAGNLRLLAPGIIEAEKRIASQSSARV